ncbi:MAG: RNA polymerase sigma factor [Muricoprocola sp.]
MQLLINKAQKGDPDAFVELMESCKGSMYRVAKGFFFSDADIADAMAETVLLAYEHLSELKQEKYFKTWLIRILINVCNNMKRKQKVYEPVEIVPERSCLDDGFSDLEFREMLSFYPEDCQIILLLYYGEQFTTREIADILRIKESTVRSKIHRVRNSLRKDILYSY